MNTKKISKGAVSKIPTSDRDSGTHSRSSSVSNITTASETADTSSDATHGFKENDRVWVNGSKPGCIKFLGKTSFALGMWAGVLLDEPVGKNDGSVDGVKYFSCPSPRGIFARPQKLTRLPGPVSATGDASSAANVPKTPVSTTPLSRVGSNLSLSSTKACSRLKIGERVSVSALTGVKSGILKYLGETDFAKGEWAGIALDEPVGKNDGSVAGKRYFSCQMKYGLFSPLHKISRAGGTSTYKAPSVRPIRRSTSRESLSSSVSNSSKASRVRLGVGSLTNSQQKIRNTGVGVMTTSRALEEALKEKDQHIEQLLMEHDLERAEVAQVTSHSEEVETKCNELLKQQEELQKERKDLEELLSADKRKYEDLQFQLEEEKILRNDLEMRLQQNSSALKRLGHFLNQNLDSKYLNIKEILEGKETLSEITVNQDDAFRARISELQIELEKVIQDKNKSLKEIDDLKISLNESNKEFSTLNTTMQEKDDVISNLKNELNAQLEKVTKAEEDMKSLNEQAGLSEGRTAEVIKEFGEKISSLTEELNSKTTLLQEYENSIQAKDSRISLSEKNLETQIQQLADLQKENQTFLQDLDQKSSELKQRVAMHETLQDEFTALKGQLDSEIPLKEEKILSLVKEIECLSSNLHETEDESAQKQVEVSNLLQSVQDLTQSNSQLQEKVQQVEANFLILGKDNSEKIDSLQAEIQLLREDKKQISDRFEKEEEALQSKVTALLNDLATKSGGLADKESHNLSLNQSLSEKDSQVLAIEEENAQIKQTCEQVIEERTTAWNSLKTKDEQLSVFEKQLGDLKSLIEAKDKDLSRKDEGIQSTQSMLKHKEEEILQLQSKLELAEQNVEMLNKDSSQHVTMLQSELSKLKDESVKVSSALEQKITVLQKANEAITVDMTEKESDLRQKEQTISVIESQLKAKENDFVQLHVQVEKLKTEVSTLTRDKEDIRASHEKQRSASKEEFYSELEKKDLKISEMQEEVGKLSQDLNEKANALIGSEDTLIFLEGQISAKESEISVLSGEAKHLKQELDVLTRQKEKIHMISEELSKASKEAFDSELSKKEQINAKNQTKILELEECLKGKECELHQKESESDSLKSTLKEREGQLDELNQMIEASQAQLQALSVQNESNEKLLQSRKSFIDGFKVEKEKQLLELEENFKEENFKLRGTVEKYEKDLTAKEEIVSRLNSDAEKQAKQLESMNDELTKSKSTNEKSIQDTNKSRKDLVEKITDLEAKYLKLIEEKKKVEDEEHKARGATKNLEEVRDNLLEEKLKTEEAAKDRETQMAALQAEVNRMQTEFLLHKQELEQKLDVSEMELQAARELKSQLDLQQSVLTDLQEQLQSSEEKCHTLEVQEQKLSDLTSANMELLNKLTALENLDKEKTKQMTDMDKKYQDLEELLKDDQNSLMERESQCATLKERISGLLIEVESKEVLQSRLKSVEQENTLLMHKLETCPEKKANQSALPSTNQDDSDERESLLSQVNFLNSIIVDMKHKNETLQQEIEILKMGPAEMDLNLNDVKKIAPRLFCDICDMFDLHDTDECPKQESFIEDEDIPQMLPHGSRKMEQRPYCNNCEIFGHWTFDCEVQDTY